MANRFPLIGNSVTKRLEELTSGDNLNLSQSGVYDGTGVGTGGQVLYSTGDGIEWGDVPAEIDTTYTIGAEDGVDGKKIIRLTDVNLVTDDIILVPGTNVSLVRSNDEITINSSYIDTDTITRLKGGVAGSFITGDITFSPSGSAFITQVGSTIIIGASDTNTITRLKGGSAGTFVTGDITVTASGASSASQAGNTINITSTDTVTRIKGGLGGTFTTGDVVFLGSGAATVTQNAQTVTINAPNTTYGLNVTDTTTTTKTISLAGSDQSSVDVTLSAGSGVSLVVDNNDIEISVDIGNIDIDDIGDVSASAPSNGNVLKYSNTSWVNAFVDYSEITNSPILASVATSGSYNDLVDTPALASVATSGSYNDLIDLPSLVVDAADLTDTTNRFFSGDYGDLTNAPLLATIATSGSYTDLLNAPNLGTVATSNSYNDLDDLPTIPPERSYNISGETNTGGATIRLNESVSNTNDDLLLESGTGISVTQTDQNTISISSTLTGLPSGFSATASSLTFEGSISDSFSTTIQILNPTLNRTVIIPNESGTVVLSGSNKTYTISVVEDDTKYFESKLGLLGSNTGASTYAIISGAGGLKVDSEDVAGGIQAASTTRGIVLTPPPTVHVGSTAPAWAKNGDLWFNNITNVLKVFDESLYPTPDAVLNYFQSADAGDSRFFCDRNPDGGVTYIPEINKFIVGPGIPTGSFVISNFTPTVGSNVGWFNLNTFVITNIPHNAVLRVYNTNPNVNINDIWRTLYEPTPSELLQSRSTTSVTTGTLLQNEAQNINFNGFKSYSLLKVFSNKYTWVTLYTDDASRSADASRSFGTPAPLNTGIVSDLVLNTNQTIQMTPSVIGWNNDTTPSGTIYARVRNLDTISEEITVTLTILKLEA
jgi:hypothetical protein